jgi:uncharacterized protein (DUF2062 family)
MKTKEKVAVVTAGSFALVGSAILATVGNPVTWAILAYSTYRIAKTAYKNAENIDKEN